MSDQIPDAEFLYRRIHINWVKLSGDVSSCAFSGKSPEIASVAYLDRKTEEVSVDRASMRDPEQTLRYSEGTNDLGPAAFGVAKLQASVPRSTFMDTRPKPIEDNPSHSVIIFVQPGLSKPQKKVAQQLLASSSDWVLPVRALQEHPDLFAVPMDERAKILRARIAPNSPEKV